MQTVKNVCVINQVDVVKVQRTFPRWIWILKVPECPQSEHFWLQISSFKESGALGQENVIFRLTVIFSLSVLQLNLHLLSFLLPHFSINYLTIYHLIGVRTISSHSILSRPPTFCQPLRDTESGLQVGWMSCRLTAERI